MQKGKKRFIVALALNAILLANCHAALFPMYFVVFLPYIAEYLISFINKKNLLTFKLKRLEKKDERLKKKTHTVFSKSKAKNNTDKNNIKINKNNEKLNKKLTKLSIKIERVKRNLKIVELTKQNKKEANKIIIEHNKNGKWLILAFVICLLAGLLTPLKDIPYTYMLKSVEGNTMHFISEHSPVALINDYSLLAIFALIIALLFSNKIKIKLADLFMLMGMSILALISYKQFSIFFICTMCIINKLIFMWMLKKKEYSIQKAEIEASNAENNKKTLIEQIKEKIKSTKKLTWKSVTYIVLAITIIAILQYKSIVPQKYVDINSYPTIASEWLKENVDIKNMRLFNDFNYGSYLLFKDIPVFIDGRADVYDPKFNGKTDDVFLDYMKASSLEVWYEEVFRKYDITHIITLTSSKLSTYLQRNSDYRAIYNDSTFIIYEANFDRLQE